MRRRLIQDPRENNLQCAASNDAVRFWRYVMAIPIAIELIIAAIPMGRRTHADEIAKAAPFLASEDSSFVTGIELFVDGGRAQV
jgi:NAD(P)-dependent dehydrogenase (short-subunit alcohol dehydrogenase family)